LCVDGKGLADSPPTSLHAIDHMPRLTLRMTAALQGFPDEWHFWGRKTAAYRQIGNAFPPPVAKAVGQSLHSAITMARQSAAGRTSSLILRAV
jgi:DNA (cytosine-5)-methyltransferase 1